MKQSEMFRADNEMSDGVPTMQNDKVLIRAGRCTGIVVAHDILFNTATHRVPGLEYRYIEYHGNTGISNSAAQP